MDNFNEDELISGQITLDIAGMPIEMNLTVPAKPVKPQRMLPIFQQMTNSFVDMGVKAIESEGESISCKKGCGACCSQAVPLAEIEAYQIAELVENFPEPRRSIVKEKFEKAFSHFAEIGWFEKLSECAAQTLKEQEKVVMEYFHEGISCPLLEEGSCSIHQDRPLACREYLVTSPAQNCSSPTASTVKIVQLPVKPSKTLMKVGQKTQISGVNFIPMVMSLKWAETNEERFEEKTGEQWMEDFFRNLTKKDIPEEVRNASR
jgi:Fe-S-cluster containining protein